MNIFITGIAGFIGFHLARHLHKNGNIVTGCDNFNDYYSLKLKKERAAILEKMGIPILHADIQDLKAVPLETTHFVHLAAQAGVRYSKTNPQAYCDTNLDGFLQILELIRQHPHIPLIYASSSSVYGLNDKIPFAETDITDRPASLYGATKKANELMAHSYHHLYGISVTGLRFFTVYGPWGRPDMAYYSFADSIVQGKLIQIYNQGKMKRDFTYIDDIVNGIQAAIDKSLPCEIFNLGNNQPEDVLTLVHLLEKKLGQKAHIKLLPHTPSEVPITYADITKSQNILGYRPKTSLDQGLDHFLTWHLEYAERMEGMSGSQTKMR